MPFPYTSAPGTLAGLTLAAAVLVASASDPATAAPATDLGTTADALGVATLTAAETANAASGHRPGRRRQGVRWRLRLKTIEGATAAEVAAAGVVPVMKTLAVDIIASDPDFPHDKAEGIAVLDRFTIAVTNDDDFGVTDGPTGLAQKILPLTDETDINRIYVFRLSEALY
jgi:hypothetical protein